MDFGLEEWRDLLCHFCPATEEAHSYKRMDLNGYLPSWCQISLITVQSQRAWMIVSRAS